MVILGLSDGAVPGAALVIDDTLVAADEGTLGDGPLPFDAMERVLALGGRTPADVDVVALAGRYTPPLQVRRRPRLRTMAREPFSPLRSLTTRWQGLLRATGFGAADADRARDWLQASVEVRGYRPRKVVAVDLHRALAASAYRLGADDRATVLVVHPGGDGLFASVHRANAGQIDRVLADRGTTGAHGFLDRVFSCLGVDGWEALLALAGDAAPDPVLRSALHEAFTYAGRFRARPGPERRGDLPWSRLAEDRVAGAATVRAHLRELLGEFVANQHVDGTTLLAGSAFVDPGWLGVRGGVFSVAPWRGDRALAVGAAADVAGLAPRAVGPDLGADVASSGPADPPIAAEAFAALIARGDTWVRCRGRAAPGPLALRQRGVWVRGDDARAVSRLREVLELPDSVAPVILRRTAPAGLSEGMRGCWALGLGVGDRTYVGAAGNPELAARLDALARRGVEEIALFPLVRRDRSSVDGLPGVRALVRVTGAAGYEYGDRTVPDVTTARTA